MSDFIYIAYFLRLIVLIVASTSIADMLIRFSKHLGHPQSDKTFWYLAGMIFLILLQLGLVIYAFRRDLFSI